MQRGVGGGARAAECVRGGSWDEARAVTHVPSRTLQMHLTKRTCEMIATIAPNTSPVIAKLLIERR